jgi:uncharacterized protein YkwD
MKHINVTQKSTGGRTMVGRTAIKRSVAVLVLGAASLFTFVPMTHAASTSAHNSLVSTRSVLLAAINADRTAKGLAPLKLDKKQSACSLQHTVAMASQNSLFHNNLSTEGCSTHTLISQNVGEASGDPSQAAMSVLQLMISEGPCPQKGCPGTEYIQHGHYVNLLNPQAHHVGIGMVVQDGTLWLTEDFTS